jgi:hypothetical protein
LANMADRKILLKDGNIDWWTKRNSNLF